MRTLSGGNVRTWQDLSSHAHKITLIGQPNALKNSLGIKEPGSHLYKSLVTLFSKNEIEVELLYANRVIIDLRNGNTRISIDEKGRLYQGDEISITPRVFHGKFSPLREEDELAPDKNLIPALLSTPEFSAAPTNNKSNSLNDTSPQQSFMIP